MINKLKTFYSGIGLADRKDGDLAHPSLSISIQGVIEGITNEQKEKDKQT